MSRFPERHRWLLLLGAAVVSTITLGVLANLVSERLGLFVERHPLWYVLLIPALLVTGAAAVYAQERWSRGQPPLDDTDDTDATDASTATGHPGPPAAEGGQRKDSPIAPRTTRRVVVTGLGLAAGAWAAPTAWDYVRNVADGIRGRDRTAVTLPGDFPVASLQFSPKGTVLAVGYQSGDVRLWDVGAATVLQSLSAPGVAHSMAYSPDGELLVTAHGSSSGDGASVWRIADGKRIATLGDNKVGPVAFTHDGAMLVTGGEGARLWDVGSWKAGAELRVKEDEPHVDFAAIGLASSPVRPYVITGGRDDFSFLWDVRKPATYDTIHGASPLYRFSPDGTIIAGIGRYGPLQQTVWHYTLGSPLGNGEVTTDPGGTPYSAFAVSTDDVTCFDFNHDGSLLVTSGGEGVALWTVTSTVGADTSMEILETLSQDPATRLAASPADTHLAGVGGLVKNASDNDVWVLDLASG